MHEFVPKEGLSLHQFISAYISQRWESVEITWTISYPKKINAEYTDLKISIYENDILFLHWRVYGVFLLNLYVFLRIGPRAPRRYSLIFSSFLYGNQNDSCKGVGFRAFETFVVVNKSGDSIHSYTLFKSLSMSLTYKLFTFFLSRNHTVYLSDGRNGEKRVTITGDDE